MPDYIPIATTISIREAGYDEYWLQDQIAAAPAALGLGELEMLQKERPQGAGGRLDLLLKDPEDDTMYEVELMLGETDETHIIRTIEYWDNEKRRYPQRQHYAVLVAESVTRRFFNVIHILSLNVPIIAIQASLIEVEGKKVLVFTKVLDTYEEPDDGTDVPTEVVNRDYWNKLSKWTAETAEALLGVVAPTFGKSELSYTKHYVALTVGRNNYLWLHRRKRGKSLLGLRIAGHLFEEAQQLLDEANISFTKKPKQIAMTIDQNMVKEHAAVFEKLAALIVKTWSKEG